MPCYSQVRSQLLRVADALGMAPDALFALPTPADVRSKIAEAAPLLAQPASRHMHRLGGGCCNPATTATQAPATPAKADPAKISSAKQEVASLTKEVPAKPCCGCKSTSHCITTTVVVTAVVAAVGVATVAWLRRR